MLSLASVHLKWNYFKAVATRNMHTNTLQYVWSECILTVVARLLTRHVTVHRVKFAGICFCLLAHVLCCGHISFLTLDSLFAVMGCFFKLIRTRLIWCWSKNLNFKSFQLTFWMRFSVALVWCSLICFWSKVYFRTLANVCGDGSCSNELKSNDKLKAKKKRLHQLQTELRWQRSGTFIIAYKIEYCSICRAILKLSSGKHRLKEIVGNEENVNFCSTVSASMHP